MKNIKMTKSVKSVSVFVRTFLVFGVCLRSLEAYESFAPVTVPVAQLPILFPDSHLRLDSEESLHAPDLAGVSDSDSNLVHVVHKEFHLQPIYKDILGDKLIDASSFGEVKSSERYVDREPRKVNSGLGNVIKSILNIPISSQTTKEFDAITNTETKSDNKEKVRQENITEEENSDGDDENTSSYESSEEIHPDDRSKSRYSNDKNGSTKKKNLQSDFFRNSDEKVNDPEEETESRVEDAKNKKSKDPQKIDIELLHTLSEQFILKNGELTKLNSSDFSLVNDEEHHKENKQSQSDTDAEASEESEIVPSHENKLIHNSRNIEHAYSSDEEIEGGYSPSKNGEGQNFHVKLTEEEQSSQEYKDIVKSLVQKKLAEILEEREREDKIEKLKNQNIRNVLQQTNYNLNNREVHTTRFANSLPQRQPLFQNVNTNRKESYNQDYTTPNSIPVFSPTQKSYPQFQSSINNNRGSYAPPPITSGKLQNSIQNLNLQRQQQNVMRQKLSLVRQLQMYNKQASISNSTLESRRISQSSSYTPANNYRYNTPSPANNPTAEADELRVFLYGSPRFTTLDSLNSPKPTRQTAENTYYDSPASYTRRPPLKLQQPSQNSPQIFNTHYDRTKYKSESQATETRPTKSSRILEDCNNDNQWVPITPRPLTSSNPEKIRTINSLSKSRVNAGYSKSINNIGQSSAEKTSSSERKAENSGYRPVSIQDIIVNQKHSSVELENPNASVENRKSVTNPSNAPVYALIDDLTGVIEKHKSLATSSEEISGSPYNNNQQASSNEILYTTPTPPTPSGKATTNNLQQQPTQYTNINVNQFHHYASSSSQPTIPTNFNNSTASSNYIESPNNESSSSPPPPPQKLHYYSDDIRGRLENQRVKTLLPVKPYVPPNSQQRQPRKNPLHAFINSLHSLREKNKNRHSHFQEYLSSLLPSKNSPPSNPEKQRNLRGNHLIPSVYDAVPVYKLDPLPQDSTNIESTRSRPFLPHLRPINPEIELIPNNNVRFPQPLKQSRPFLPRRPESDDDEDSISNRKPKEYLGDTYARLGENLVYRVHDIFKQFIPPVLHIGPSTPPK